MTNIIQPLSPTQRRIESRAEAELVCVDICGIHGTPEQVRERLEEMVAMGANHLLLNPVSRYAEQLEALAEVVGLK